MASITELDGPSVANLCEAMRSDVTNCGCLEEAAQKFLDHVYDAVGESLALARIFVSVPYGELPESNQAFVSKLAESNGVADQLNDATPVLSLVGSRGQEDSWNDRRDSAGHVGIPLISAQFVDAIPMVARLLHDLGVGPDIISDSTGSLDVHATGAKSGAFLVEEASESVDSKGRKIIAAQDFVESQGVRTVFGVGGQYAAGGNNLMVALFFTKVKLSGNVVATFGPLIELFKEATIDVVGEKKIFA